MMAEVALLALFVGVGLLFTFGLYFVVQSEGERERMDRASAERAVRKDAGTASPTDRTGSATDGDRWGRDERNTDDGWGRDGNDASDGWGRTGTDSSDDEWAR